MTRAISALGLTAGTGVLGFAAVGVAGGTVVLPAPTSVPAAEVGTRPVDLLTTASTTTARDAAVAEREARGSRGGARQALPVRSVLPEVVDGVTTDTGSDRQVQAEARRLGLAADEFAERAAAEESARVAAVQAAEAQRVAQVAAEAQRVAAEAAALAQTYGVEPDSNRALAVSMLGSYGWGRAQFECLDSLWQRESNWDHLAENPSSGAYGIPQSLPARKMASVAEDWRTNPATQITWGLTYIEDAYGTPCSAWSFWQDNNWY